MSIIFPTKADVVAAITNQEVGLALTVATQLNQMMTDSPNLSYKVPVKCGDVNLFKSAFKQYEETLVSQGWTVVYTEVHWTDGNIAILVS